MGLREKVTITLVIIALIQIACRHCMPRTPRKASLKQYLNDLKPVKNNPAPTPNSPSRLNKTPKQTFGKTYQNGRISQNSIPKKSLYQKYKFPEIEYPLDNSPRDPFHVEMNFNDNNYVSTLQKARNLQSTSINELKKEMKMKRKLLSNKQMNNENNPLKQDMPSIKFSSYPDSKHLLDSESFPEVQYPLNTMDTWGANYRSYLPFTQENQFNGFGHQTLNRQAKEDINKPFTRLTKAKATKYLQSYDKLKEEQRRTSTENSKRSNAGQKGLNFTKIATCEKISDDFMTAGLLSNIPSKSPEIKRTLEPSTKINASSENTCPVTEHSNHSVSIPYRVIENNSENMRALEQKNNTKELQDMDTSCIAKTLQLIEEILFCDDTSSVSTGNYSREIENNVDSSNCNDVETSYANEDIPTTLMQKNSTDSPEELSQEVLDDAPADILQAKIPSPPEVISAENNSTFLPLDPLSVRMSFPFSEPIEFEAVTNASERGLTNMAPIANSNTVPGSTSIIIIPINNNADGKSLSHILETTTGTPIIFYLPSTQNSGIPSQTQIVSSSLDNSVPNNELYNVLSKMAPLQNDNPPSTALESELLNSISDSGSSLPIYETLPTNSMCYNNESSPSSMKEKPVSDILIHKSLTDDAPICDEKLYEQLTETDNFVMNTETLPPTPDFEHPLFDFSGSDFSSLSHGPYNNVLKSELPILAREINSNQQIFNVTSKDLYIPIQKNISKDYLTEITNDTSIVALHQNFSFETPNSIPEPIIIDQMPPTPLTGTAAEPPLPISTSRSLTPLPETLSSNLSGIWMDTKLSATPSVTTDSAPQLLDNTLSPTPNVNNSPMTTDMSIKTELYKIRQILDKMLSSETPTNSQITPMAAIISPIADTERLPMLVNESLEPSQTLIDSDRQRNASLPVVDNTPFPIPSSDTTIDSLQLKEHEPLPHNPADGTSSDTLPLPGKASGIPSFLFDTADIPLLLIDETVPPTPVLEHPAENKPYLIDNLVTPLSDDVPSKMDLVIPNIYELPCDELPYHSVDDLPIMVHKEPKTNPKSEDSTKNLPTQLVEPQNLHCNVQVQTTTIGGYTNEIQQDFLSSAILQSSENEKKQKVDLSIIPDVPRDAFANEAFLPDDSLSPINAKIGDFPHINTNNKDLLSVEDHLLSPEDEAHPDTIVTNSRGTVSLSNNLNKELSEYTFSDLPRGDLILTNDKILPVTDNTSSDLPLPINQTPTTSKLSIAKALLENVLSDITKGGFSSSETKPLPVTPSSILHKTKYQVDVKSPILEAKEIPPAEKIFPKSEALTNLPNPEKTEKIIALPLDRAPSITPNLDIPTKDLPLKIDKESTGLSPDQTDDVDKCFSSQEGTETLPLDNPDNDLLPTDKVLPVNTVNRNSISNKNTRSESKLLITKELLENILSDFTTKGFSLPAASTAFPMKSPSVLDKTFYLESPMPVQAEKISSPSEIPPVNENVSSTTHSDQPTDNNLTFSGQTADTMPLRVDKTLAEVSSLDIPSEILKYKALLKSDVDMTSPKGEILPKETPSDLPSSNTKTLSSSKLPVAKALLQNVLSDVTSKSFSLPVSKVLPVKSSSVIEKTFHYLESPLSDRTEVSNLSSNNEIISSTSLPDEPSDNNLPFAGKSNETLPLEIDKTLAEVSSLDILSEMTSPMDKSIVDISSPEPAILPKNIPSELPLTNTNTLSSSKLSIAKALLQNVLSDVTSKSFSLPVSKVLPVKSSSVIEKTSHHLESPLSDRTEVSNLSSNNEIILSTTLPDEPSDNNLPFAGKFNETLPLEIDKTVSEVSSLDIPSEMTSPMDKSIVDISSPEAAILPKNLPSEQPLSNTKTLSSSKLSIAKALLQNVLTDVTSKAFSLSVSKALPVKSTSALDETLYYVESPLSYPIEGSPLTSVDDNISSTTFPHQPADNNLISGQSEETLPSEVEKMLSEVSSLDIPSEMSSLAPNVGITSPKAEIIPKATPSDLPLLNTKTLSRSKLSITKALLENVLSDMNTKEFSLPVAKSLPVESRTQLDKTLYYMESPLSDWIEELSSQDNFPCSETNEDVFELSLEKIFTENPNLDMPTDDLPIDQIYKDGSENLTEEIEDEESTNLPTQVDKQLSLYDDMSHDLRMPQNKRRFTSRIPITKALLEKVLSDISDGVSIHNSVISSDQIF